MKNKLLLILLPFMVMFSACGDQEDGGSPSFELSPSSLEKGRRLRGAIQGALRALETNSDGNMKIGKFESLVDSALLAYANESEMEVVDSIYKAMKSEPVKAEDIINDNSSSRKSNSTAYKEFLKAMNAMAQVASSMTNWSSRVIEYRKGNHRDYSIGSIERKTLDDMHVMAQEAIKAYERFRVRPDYYASAASASRVVPLNLEEQYNDGSSFWNGHGECLVSYTSGAIYRMKFEQAGLSEDLRIILAAHNIVMSEAGIIVCD
ncbi:hypothetical protein [Aureibacter tunicatorum]|uniref:Lipoprotein n=1 Tax=Aureibacter tunicatorum TaxID=866807 RepID=A0AAE4BUJ6_9BACT|nr:hypothetical protein [Aureibacter tunicatorum]MDR6241856.1 hypothetical protein [Aureibacter tunicatorum]BDD07103.1 hypothetical protein AUTU_45860 [Aureibacter tunicatorum]